MVKTLLNIQKWLNNDDIIIDVISMSDNYHPAVSGACVLIIKKIGKNECQYIPIDCYDSAENFTKAQVEDFFKLFRGKIFCLFKKKVLHLIKIDNLLDLSLIMFLETGEILEEEDYNTTAHTFFNHKYQQHRDLNKIIPVTNHISKFLDFCDEVEGYAYKKQDQSYYNINNIVIDALFQIESNGLFVDRNEFINHFDDKQYLVTDDMIYTEYNIFTSTGRPSNRFGGINYAALNKENGCRKSFISRFGDNGMLILIDYSAYHPHIIAKLVNYEFPDGVNIYEFLGKCYFKKDILTDEEIKKSKNLTFQQFYGTISDEYVDFPYFKKIKEYINHRWSYFSKYNYIETPIYNRRITSNHLKDPNPNKLFNYILQASETEYSMQSLVDLNNFLKNKNTKPILYTYDSMLFDVDKRDGKAVILEIKKIMEKNGFPTKCYYGVNYNDMKLITF